MRYHLGILIAVLAILALIPLECTRGTAPPSIPRPPGPASAPAGLVLRPVRVLLADQVTEAWITIPENCAVVHRITGRALEGPPAAGEVRVSATPEGFTIGPRTYPGGVLDLVPTGETPLGLAGQRYRGSLRLVHAAGEAFRVVNVVAMEAYLAGVINGEMPSNWPAEALKAQAVAARTYALYQTLQRSPASAYDLRADEWSQMYLGVAGETPRSRALVAETAGLVLLYQGAIFCTYYSSTCGGHTQDGKYVFEDGDLPPLAGVACPYCRHSKYYQWTEVVPLAQVSAAVNAHLARRAESVGEVRSLQVLQRAPSGHVVRIRVEGTGGAADLTGQAFRHALGTRVLRSTRFEVAWVGGAMRFTGRGFGHGVGMCQVGAKGAAEAGLDFLRILQYYYPHAVAVRVPAAGESLRSAGPAGT